MTCTLNAGATSCGFIDLSHQISVTLNGVTVQLTRRAKLTPRPGPTRRASALTREDLLADLWVSGNFFLDTVLNFAEADDLPQRSPDAARGAAASEPATALRP